MSKPKEPLPSNPELQFMKETLEEAVYDLTGEKPPFQVASADQFGEFKCQHLAQATDFLTELAMSERRPDYFHDEALSIVGNMLERVLAYRSIRESLPTASDDDEIRILKGKFRLAYRALRAICTMKGKVPGPIPWKTAQTAIDQIDSIGQETPSVTASDDKLSFEEIRHALFSLNCGISVVLETDPTYTDTSLCRIDKDDLKDFYGLLDRIRCDSNLRSESPPTSPDERLKEESLIKLNNFLRGSCRIDSTAYPTFDVKYWHEAMEAVDVLSGLTKTQSASSLRTERTKR